jgi:hypothetical protein
LWQHNSQLKVVGGCGNSQGIVAAHQAAHLALAQHNSQLKVSRTRDTVVMYLFYHWTTEANRQNLSKANYDEYLYPCWKKNPGEIVPQQRQSLRQRSLGHFIIKFVFLIALPSCTFHVVLTSKKYVSFSFSFKHNRDIF